MPELSRCCNSPKYSLKPSPSLTGLLLYIAVVTITMAGPRTAANAADDANAATAASSPADIIDRLSRKQAAAQRIEELDQEAWKAISKEGDLDLAIMNMSHAAELARSEFGAKHWLTVLKETVATGMKSLAELPPARKQLFIEATRGESFAVFQWSQGNKERALSQMRRAHDKRIEAVGADHVLAATFLLGLSHHEREAQDFGEAKRHAADAVRFLKTRWGEKNPGWAHALYHLALAERGLHELEPAERHFRDVIEILEPVAREGFNDFYLMVFSDAQLHVARLLNDRGRFADAEPFARHGSEILAFAKQNAYGKFVESQLDVARSVSGQGKTSEADIIFNCLFKSLPANPPPEAIARVLAAYTEHLRRIHRDADAEQLEARIRKLSVQTSKPKSNSDGEAGITPSQDK